MAQKRARLTDENNPLKSKTDDFLDGLGQVNQPTTQETNKLASQEVNNSETLQTITGQQADQTAPQEVGNIASQQANKLTSQQNNQPANILRKATFKLSAGVLRRLDNYHLQLQLELGKVDAPYKEVIVEEAICRLLDQAELTPSEVLSVLRSRQESRD